MKSIQRKFVKLLSAAVCSVLLFSEAVPAFAQENTEYPSGENMMEEAVAVLAAEDDLSEDPVLPSVNYQTHVQTYGWQETCTDGETAGTTGEAKRLEAIKISLSESDYTGGIRYQTHVQTYGWMDWKENGDVSGTTGESKRLEAVRISLFGDIAEEYDIYYRVHIQNFGWLGWAKNGETAGSAGLSKRMEAIEIKLIKKEEQAPEQNSAAYVTVPAVTCQVHVQSYGWMPEITNGTAGVTGESKRMEAMKLQLSESGIPGSIQYRAHVQTYGWQDWTEEGEIAGTTGESKRLEAVQIRLTGTIESMYDIYYRVHIQTYGWLGWAKNGEEAGSEGLSKRLEAIEVRLVAKNAAGPSDGGAAFVEKTAEGSGDNTIVSDPNGIYGNGTGGIYIDIHSAPYTTFATYAYGQYAYTSEGCAWFASSRVRELTGIGNTIWSGSSWWNGGAGKYGFATGQTIRSRALACYTNHVSVVERVEGDKVYLSEGGYSASGAAHGYTIIRETTVYGVTHGRNGVGSFLGYVYLP